MCHIMLTTDVHSCNGGLAANFTRINGVVCGARTSN